jgi:hypothetical protein
MLQMWCKPARVMPQPYYSQTLAEYGQYRYREAATEPGYYCKEGDHYYPAPGCPPLSPGRDGELQMLKADFVAFGIEEEADVAGFVGHPGFFEEHDPTRSTDLFQDGIHVGAAVEVHGYAVG